MGLAQLKADFEENLVFPNDVSKRIDALRRLVSVIQKYSQAETPNLVSEMQNGLLALRQQSSYANEKLENFEVEFSDMLEDMSKQSRNVRRIFNNAIDGYKAALKRYHQCVLNAEDELSTLLWDFDPNAKDIETFDSPDDLIASLKA